MESAMSSLIERLRNRDVLLRGRYSRSSLRLGNHFEARREIRARCTGDAAIALCIEGDCRSPGGPAPWPFLIDVPALSMVGAMGRAFARCAELPLLAGSLLATADAFEMLLRADDGSQGSLHLRQGADGAIAASGMMAGLDLSSAFWAREDGEHQMEMAHRRMPTKGLAAEVALDAATTLANNFKGGRGQSLYDALFALTGADQTMGQILRLRILEGCKQAQIATRLGLPEPQVRQALARASSLLETHIALWNRP